MSDLPDSKRLRMNTEGGAAIDGEDGAAVHNVAGDGEDGSAVHGAVGDAIKKCTYETHTTTTRAGYNILK